MTLAVTAVSVTVFFKYSMVMVKQGHYYSEQWNMIFFVMDDLASFYTFESSWLWVNVFNVISILFRNLLVRVRARRKKHSFQEAKAYIDCLLLCFFIHIFFIVYGYSRRLNVSPRTYFTIFGIKMIFLVRNH